MIIQQDPFQLITAVNCEPGIVVSGAGTIIQSDAFFNYELFDLCSTPEFPDRFPWPSYASRFLVDLTAPILDCNQLQVTITGQTSGVSTFWGYQPVFSDLGLACGEKPGCYVQLNETTYANNNGVGVWSTLLKRWQYSHSVFDKVQRGYTNGETIDIEFLPGPEQSIEQISERTAGTIWIDATAHGYPDDSWLDIAGTTNYDGTYQVNFETTDRFFVTKAYVEDEAQGTIQPNYNPT